MKKISLCMIVKNEEDVLERCLKNAHICFDEIVIVDTGSTDNTKEIAKKFTDKIFDFVWVNDFSKARNFAFSKASNELVMWLDADDVLEEQEAKKIKTLAENFPKNVTNIRMPYHTGFDEHGNVTFSYYRERLFLKSACPIWIEPIHEYCHCPGQAQYVDIVIKHKKLKPTGKNRNLNIFMAMKEKGQPFSTRLQYYYARELIIHNQNKKAIKEFKKFLKMQDAWHINKVEACLEMSTAYLRLGNTQEALNTLFQSFNYALPTGEALCKIAQIYESQNKTKEAIYYYELALEKSRRLEGGFVQNDFYTYIPAINLCVLHFKQKNIEKAEVYNNLCGLFKPKDTAYLFNKKFFKFYKLKQKARLKTKEKFNKISNQSTF